MATMSVTLGQVAGAHPALTRLTLVLVTREGHRKKPRETRCTDGLLRWRRVWREQELWIVPKEATARWGSVKSFHRLSVTLLGGVSRLTGSHRTQLPFFFFYQEQGRSKSGWMFLPDIFPGISDKPKFFVPSFPQTTVPANPFCKKAMSQGTADGVDWYQCEHDYQCPKPILSAL